MEFKVPGRCEPTYKDEECKPMLTRLDRIIAELEDMVAKIQSVPESDPLQQYPANKVQQRPGDSLRIMPYPMKSKSPQDLVMSTEADSRVTVSQST
jgi:hypothetical protein